MSAKDGFIERDPGDEASYLAEEQNGVSRESLIRAMEALLPFTKRAAYQWENDYEALIYATVARSGRTFDGVCKLLRVGLAVQAAMLTRSLFEDMVIGHWLLYNYDDPDWLVEKFLRQREAIALHQQRLQKQTGFAMGPPIPVPKGVAKRAKELAAEFGGEAQRDWWNPGREGKGRGGDVKLRKLVSLLEDVAAEQKMFHPRFAGGEEPLLRRMDLVTHKWMNQCIHHTTIGLPFTPTEEGKVEVSPDPMLIVGWNSSWIYTQQIYLLFDLNNMDGRELERRWWQCMIKFSETYGQTEWTKRLRAELDRMGDDDPG
jgi:hypothetical protein